MRRTKRVHPISMGLLTVLMGSPTAMAQLANNKKVTATAPVAAQPTITVEEQLRSQVGKTQLFIQEDGAMSALVGELREAILQSAEHGLIPAMYWTEEDEATFEAGQVIDATNFEAAMTEKLLRFARHLQIGRVNPELMGEDVAIKSRVFVVGDLAQAMNQVNGRLVHKLASLAPRSVAYQQLKEMLALLTATQDDPEWGPIAAPKATDVGKSRDPAYSAVKQKLAKLGYNLSEFGDLYTRELLEVVKTYYQHHNLEGNLTLKAGSVFWRHINVPIASRIQQVKLSMEKLRWFAPQNNAKVVFVNAAFQNLRVYKNNELQLAMKTINGRTARKTPMLNDRIPIVELNPDWVAPPRIVLEDKVEQILKDPGYLDQANMEVLDARGNRLSPWSVDWANLDRNALNGLRLRQKPGLGNALGILKFHLTNDKAIYLHDTNERSLFDQSFRLRSSGCVRVEFPELLAENLLEEDPTWSQPGVLAANLSQWQVTDKRVKEEHLVRLARPVPTMLTYLTAEYDESRIFKFAFDHYGQDQRLFELLKRTGDTAAQEALAKQFAASDRAARSQAQAQANAKKQRVLQSQQDDNSNDSLGNSWDWQDPTYRPNRPAPQRQTTRPNPAPQRQRSFFDLFNPNF